ncbi:heterokaryon incompatibility protein [Colletotrichum scovillei]|uniref:Heterokaryon incompatibility protein n=1 Tax=Colletotrichum scovillei TaxID=1209932 RepID=A0A9P7UGZ2_9PEZI|nr:heterokaryon incompatibility protein [Colletotrichum scovillei]KAG7076007.1 heterokaryon incompatibility protein [Colletotrichum scovillei]KAG7083154.1 heterokaryon incompatibility protein [Colletotrichum scovillei]
MPSVPPLPDQQDIAEFSYIDDKVILPSASTHIRLLELYPSTHGFDAASASASGAPSNTDEGDSDNASSHYSSPLRCALSTTPIATPRLYKALSYTWGTSGATHSIDIEGASLLVTASLDTALRHIRRKDEPVTLWIDQICINQEDGAEKGNQVALMTQIYTKAEQVIVWLGPAENNSDALMECLQEIGQEAADLNIESYLTKEGLPLLHRIMRNENPEDPVTMQYQPLMAKAVAKFKPLLHEMIAWNERVWFTRVWIIQEQALGTDPFFLCGYKTVRLDLIPLATLVWDGCMSTLSVPTETSEFRQLLLKAQQRRLSPLMSLRRRRRNFMKGIGPGDDFYYVLKKAYVDGAAQVTELRDRIYGLLSIANDADILGITPDYVTQDSRPTFIDAARALIRVGRLEMLSFSQFPKDVEGLPSWVPDWRPTLEHSYLYAFEDADQRILQASGGTSTELVPTDDRDVLGIRGILVDTIETTGDAWRWEQGQECRYKLLQTIKTLCEEAAAKGFSHEIYENSDRQAEAMWRVPVADLYWNEGTVYRYQRPDPAVRSDYEDCMHCHKMLFLTFEVFPPEERQQLLDEFSRRIPGQSNYSENMDKMTGKRPYMTQKGYVGMGPGKACPGDVVVILFGSRIPYVLRPSGDGTMYCFVGEAYCDGVMDGELLTKREKTTFLIA